MAVVLDDLGLRVRFGRAGFSLEDAGLDAAVDRLSAALDQLEAAWAAVPAGARRAFGDLTVTLHGVRQPSTVGPTPAEDRG